MKVIVLSMVMFSSVLGAAVAQTNAINGTYTRTGVTALCLSALIWTVQHLLRVYMPEQRKEFTATLDKIVERSERHTRDSDLQRKEEAEKFRVTMDNLGNNCSRMQEVLREACDRRDKV